MFGHDSQPSRVYSYVARPPSDPAQLAAVEEQMRLAHRYRNALVEHERARRAIVDAALAELSPRLLEVEAAIPAAERQLEVALGDLKREQARLRKKVRPALYVERIAAARGALRLLRDERKRLRVDLFVSSAWTERQAEIEDAAKAAKKGLRAANGLYWSSYLHVENSMGGARSGAPPRFARWDGGGHLAVQCQGGLDVPAMLGGRSPLLAIDAAPPPLTHAKNGHPLPQPREDLRRVVRFRIGSLPSGAPIWAHIPIVLHRPLPDDGTVKWAHLIRRRIGTHCEWRVQFVLSRESGWAPTDLATSGAVGVDVGWRMRPDGSLRVAYWMGDDGAEGELALDAGWLGQMKKVEDLRSIRDKLVNEAKTTVDAWLGNRAPSGYPYENDDGSRHPSFMPPDWLSEATTHLASWRSAGRLAALAIRWRGERFDGDATAFDGLEAWRKRDRHLLEYEANLRDQLQRSRADRYRVFAAQMRRRYRTIVVESLDLRQFHKTPAPDEPAKDGALKEHARDACLSALLGALRETGAAVAMPAQYTTADCATCGSREQVDGEVLSHRCSQCAELWDQDRNAAKNLLLAGTAEPVAANS